MIHVNIVHNLEGLSSPVLINGQKCNVSLIRVVVICVGVLKGKVQRVDGDINVNVLAVNGASVRKLQRKRLVILLVGTVFSWLNNKSC